MFKTFQYFTECYNLEQAEEAACASTSLTQWANIYKYIHIYFQAPPFSSSQKNVSFQNNSCKSKYNEKTEYLLFYQVIQFLVKNKTYVKAISAFKVMELLQ